MSATQAGRYLRLTTPLGDDALLLVGVRGREAVSSLFDSDLDLLAVDNVPFDPIESTGGLTPRRSPVLLNAVQAYPEIGSLFPS